MIAIIDYGVGNLRSVQKAFEKAGAGSVCITRAVRDIEQADKVVLPGVGAMGAAMDDLKKLKLIDSIYSVIKAGKPFLGICLGFQLLFDKSFEFGEVPGLGLLAGTVERFPSTLKVPQIGWNSLHLRESVLWKDIPDNSDVYFCHSFYARPSETSIIAATTDYGIEYCCAVQAKNIFGVQFHPEKSQTVGLKILENFIKI